MIDPCIICVTISAVVNVARFQKRKLSKKEEAAQKKQAVFAETNQVEQKITQVKSNKSVFVPKVVSVKDLAEIMALPVTSVISALMKNGVLATINENIDFETAEIIGHDLGFTLVEEPEKSTIIQKEIVELTGKNLIPRPPVVAIMGHVDHGKTTLLDSIRKTQVAAGESGGITQHISAFQVKVNYGKVKDRAVTFIDTPGHAAFSAMRSHGASITDIAVLIVAADDGVMPQTIEVIEQTKANNVPVIVAINKIDAPGADPMRVKQQLVEHGLNPEEWGGETVMVEVSAKTGKGVEDLLEAIVLVADLKEYKADPEELASGVVIESHMHKGSGPLALVLIENGSLKKGQSMVVGSFWGKVRILQDSLSNNIDIATPSMPVRIAGLNGMPTFGDRILVVGSEKEAKEQAGRSRTLAAADFVSAKIKTEDSREKIEYNVVIKSDVQGSLEAIRKSLAEITHPEIMVNIVHEGIGAVSESDINMAKATQAMILAFRVNVLAPSKRLADLEQITVVSYDVIYKLLDEVKVNMAELLSPEIVENFKGRLKVLAIFKYDKKKTIFGGIVEEGEISKGDNLRIMRGEKVIYSGLIESVRKGKDEVPSMSSGSECGISVAEMVDVLENDEVVAFRTEEVKKTVS